MSENNYIYGKNPDDEVTLSFGDEAHLYENTQDTTKKQYVWTKDEKCTRYVGYWGSGTGNDDKTPAGTITSNALSVKYGSVTYTVTVPTITINNPY